MRPKEDASPDPLYLIANRVGRLVEARVFSLKTREDADAYARDLAVEVARVPKEMHPVLCADHRPVRIYSQPAADRLTQLFVQMNTRLARVAIVVAPTNATLAMQLQRIVREASYSARRVFFEAEDATAHLGPSLTSTELARVREFLADDWPSMASAGDRAAP